MKKIFVLMIPVFCLAACSSMPDQRFVGADSDAHGCIASAGYTWSEARQNCIRVWKDAIRLDSVAQDKTVAYIVLSEDGTLAEIFLTVQTKPVLLKRAFSQDGPFWKGTYSPWLLKRLAQGWRLYNGDRLLYSAANPQWD